MCVPPPLDGEQARTTAPSISVLVATRNGERTVGRLCDALCAMQPPAAPYELLVVDNGSSDGTRQVLERYLARLPLRILSCPSPGKNAALTLALAEARGQLLVFTDDDTLPNADWLCEWQALAAAHPSVDIFGGRIAAEWPGPLPDWIRHHVPLAPAFGVHDSGLHEGADLPYVIWGGNMMLRRTVFELGFRFDQGVGPAPGQYAMGSETELVRRLADAGRGCYFSNRPEVRHIIRPHQLTRSWLLGRARRYGKGNCFSEASRHLLPRDHRLLLGMPRWRLRRLLGLYVRALAAGAWLGTARSFQLSWDAHQELGYCLQFRALSNRR